MPFPIAAAAVAAGSVISSIISGAMNSDAQDSANSTNLASANATNNMNYRIFHEQQQFNENQFNKYLDYSTPLAQRQRFEQAGINPYMAVGQLSSGSPSSSLTSANSVPMQAGHVMPVTGLGDALQGSIERAANVYSTILNANSGSALTAAQTAGQNIDNSYKGKVNDANINKTNAEAKRTNQENQFFDYTLSQRRDLMNISVDTARQQKELLDQQVYGAKIANSIATLDLGIQSKYKEVMFKQQLANLVAQKFATYESVKQGWSHVAIDRQNANTNSYNAKTNRMNADTNRMNAQTNAAVGSAQIRSLIASSIKTAEETAGVKIDNKTKADLNDELLQSVGLDNERKLNENFTPSHIRHAKENGGLEGYFESTVDWLGNRLNTSIPFKSK